MKKLIFALFVLVTSAVSSQAQVCAGLVGMQAQLCPLHGQIHAAFIPGSQVTLATLQTQLSAVVNTANSNGIISNSNAATLNAQIGSGGTAGSILGVPPTAAQLRTVLLNINTNGTPADYQPSMVSLINGSFPTGSTIGISAEDTREVLKDLTLTMFRVRIGTNLQWFFNFNNYAAFTDIALSLNGAFASWDNGLGGNDTAAAPLDSTGAPTTCNAGGCGSAVTQAYPNGPSNVYTASWIGTGNVNCFAGCTAGTITSSGGRNQRTITINLQSPPPTAGNAPFINLSATPPVSDIHIIAPVSLQYQPNPSTVCTANFNTPCIFLNTYINLVRPFTSYRLMDALGILPDASTGNAQNWTQRLWPNGTLAASCSPGPCTAGAPNSLGWSNYEVWFHLANILQKDLYINQFMLASDNYMCRLARLMIMGESGIKDNGSNCNPNAAPGAGIDGQKVDEPQYILNSNSHVYLEWCNEEWNSGNNCWTSAYCLANGAAPSGHTCLTSTLTVPSGMATLAAEVATARWKNNANFPNSGAFGRIGAVGMVQAMAFNNIFTAVYTAAGKSPSQTRTVLDSQISGVSPDALFYMNSFYNPIGSHVWGASLAPYFGLNSVANNGSVAAIFNDLNTQVMNPSGACYTGQFATNMQNQITQYGMKVISYEGAQGLGLADNCFGSNPNCPVCIVMAEHTAQTDPQMYGTYVSYWNIWASVVGRNSQFHNFTLVGQYNSGGSDWGALISTLSHGSQKYDSMLNFLCKPGDVNCDGVVDINDCLTIQANFNVPAPADGWWWQDGDLNHDGLVNQADKNILNSVIKGPQCL